MVNPDAIMTLAACIRQARMAIGRNDLPCLEQALIEQHKIVEYFAENPGVAKEYLRRRPDHALDLTTETAVFARVLRRTSQTVRALLALANTDETLYSLETLPRR